MDNTGDCGRTHIDRAVRSEASEYTSDNEEVKNAVMSGEMSINAGYK